MHSKTPAVEDYMIIACQEYYLSTRRRAARAGGNYRRHFLSIRQRDHSEGLTYRATIAVKRDSLITKGVSIR